MDQLRYKALSALEDELARAVQGPVKRTKLLSSTLAFLSNFTDDRQPFDRFWREIGDRGEARWHNANAALDAIHDALGCGRGAGPRIRGMELHERWGTRKERKSMRFLSAVLSGMESQHKKERDAKSEE